MNALIVVKEESSKAKKDLLVLEKILKNKKIKYQIISYSEVENFYKKLHEKDMLKKFNYDILISFGGDGTILKSARIARKLNLPVLGINEGNLGFLNSIPSIKDVKKYIDKIENGDFIYEKRSMIDMQIFRDNKEICKAYAVNEATILTKNLGKIGEYVVYIDDFDSEFNRYRSDGLIISNPTGSTGHSFSAGGPIVAPNVNAFIITAICPHSFNQRSIVINGDGKIYIKIIKDNQVVDIDGRISIDLNNGDIVKIVKLKKELKFITFEKNHFLNNIKSKIKNI